MYRRPKFLEILLEIREEMSREAEFDIGLFVEKSFSTNVKKDEISEVINRKSSNGFKIITETIIKKD